MALAKHNPAPAEINRRNLLRATPAAGLAAMMAGAVPVAADTETPVMRAYRDWRAYSEWLNGPATLGMSNEDFSDLVDEMTEGVKVLVAIPSQSHMDTIIKFLVVVDDYQFFANVDGLEALEDEARALVGA